jgi:hypothetical protein
MKTKGSITKIIEEKKSSLLIMFISAGMNG